MSLWYKLQFTEINREKYNDTIMPKMWEILEEIYEKVAVGDDQVLYLGLYGSQNYRMDNTDSDIDCECFIFPWDDDLLYGNQFFSKCITTKYGTCHVKDIRMAFNELIKSSPNILEVLATPYAIVNKDYEFIINQIYMNINYYARMNPGKLIKGLEGLLNRYLRTVETSYKSYANVLRVSDMIQGIIDGNSYLRLLVPYNFEELRSVKKRSYPVDKSDIGWFTKLQDCRNTIIKDFYEKNSFIPNSTTIDDIRHWESELMIKYIKLRF